MFDVILLVCATAVMRGDCDATTARIVLKGPQANNEIACAMRSQAYFAGTAFEIGEDEYLKIRCARAPDGDVLDQADLVKPSEALENADTATGDQNSGS